MVSLCPVLRELNGELAVAGLGCDANTRLLVTGGKDTPVVELADAVRELMALLPARPRRTRRWRWSWRRA